MEDVPPPPLDLVRTVSEGGIPIFQAGEITVTNKPKLNFDNLVPAWDKLWFGPIQFEIGGDAWALEGFLNFGAEGQTYTAVQKSTGRKMAAKFCSSRDSREVELVQKMPRELVAHPNLIRYEMMFKNISTHFNPAQHVIVMEQVPNGELFEFIASAEPAVKGKPVSQGTSRRFLQDIISGMAECYRFGVTHRDLKPENLLINEEGRIVIIDMGHAKCAEAAAPAGGLLAPIALEKTTTANPYGTPAFNAPEVGHGTKYDCEASDVWSVGVIAFTLHSKLPAFSQGGGIASWYDISGEDNQPFWKRIEDSGYYLQFPEELKAFINALWRKTPTERPTFSQLNQAIAGDTDVLAQFPGLQWLAQDVNDVDSFVDELLVTRPGMSLQIAGRETAAKAKRW